MQVIFLSNEHVIKAVRELRVQLPVMVRVHRVEDGRYRGIFEPKDHNRRAII